MDGSPLQPAVGRMAKKPAKKAPKKSAPKKAPARRAPALKADSSASSYSAPETMSTTVREHGSVQQGAKRSPLTGVLILAVPVVIGIALVVFKDKIFPPGPETSKTESTMRSGDPQKPGDAKKPGDKPAEKKPEVKADGKVIEYVVQAGDTLAKIATAKLGNPNRAQEIVVLNPGLKPEALKAGMKIKIPAAK